MLAFRRSKGFCECTRTDHQHQGRCENPILWRNRGLKTQYAILLGVWEIRHKISLKLGGSNNAKNLEVLCFTCNRKFKKRSISLNLHSIKRRYVFVKNRGEQTFT